MSSAGQVAIVTGASSGIGWSLAKLLAAEGYRVGLMARRKDKLMALAEEIKTSGGSAVAAEADVGERSSVLQAVEQIRGQLVLSIS